MTERTLDANLRTMLVDNSPFQYAYLVKFERPSRPDENGKTSTSRERYTYITNASRDVNFDDGSTNLNGVPNGNQVYLANKLLSVSSISEHTEAKATSVTVTLDGNGIGAYAGANGVVIASAGTGIWDLTWPSSVDLIYNGFREGDKVAINSFGNFNIVGFRQNNVLRVSRIDSDLTAGTQFTSLTLASEEIKSILLDKNSASYSSFINREVFIYRAYFQAGLSAGTPILMFKGIISDVSFEDSDTGITVAWGMTSQWGDFAQVRGRITSDDFHRALDQNGAPQPRSALKPAYAYDKGFSHSDTSVNMLAKYVVQVEKQDVKVKKGFLGIGSKVKVKKYMVNEDRNTSLDIQLQAKSIPLIYGVRNTKGVNIFADTLNNDTSTVYLVYALSEGEIGGVYDIYVNGNSLICNDKSDFDARSTQNTDNTVQLICRGRSDRGDVLGGVSSVSSTLVQAYSPEDAYMFVLNGNLAREYYYNAYVPPTVTVNDTSGQGIIDGNSISLTSPQKITIDVFSGKPGQKAASSLVTIAKAKNFKVQNDYWKGTNTADYWGPDHRLLDTAYVVVKVVIEEGETQLPELEFIVRGKAIKTYNYDYSFSHYNKAVGESHTDFNLGDYVTLQTMAGVALGASTQIIDKWTITNPDGSQNVRFRTAQPPNLGFVNGFPLTTKFQMKSASGKLWTMITHNYEEYRGTAGTEIFANIQSVSNVGGYVRFNYIQNAFIAYGGTLNTGASLRLATSTNGTVNGNYFSDAIFGQGITNANVTTNYSFAAAGAEANSLLGIGTKVTSVNTLRLSSNGPSNVDDFYKGHMVQVTRYDAVNDKQVVQEAEIISYSGAGRVATVDTIWAPGFEPKAGDLIVITPKYADTRISINPALQTLDYVTSTTYGRGLDPVRDLNLPSWLTAAQTCDAQSNVTMKVTSATMPSAGQVYRWPDTGTIIWQGTVVGSAGGYIEFTNILGKFTNAWNSWKTYKTGELMYADNRVYRVNSDGVIPTKPTFASGSVGSLTYLSSLSLTSSNGGPALSLAVDGNPIRAVDASGSYISGYSLYDSDGVNYWRLLGWDEFSQRYVTRHQTNIGIDTSLPMFDNINSMLEHFGGILRYDAGKYSLEVEEPSPLIADLPSEVRNITSDDIIGKINLSDSGIKSAFNSLTASFPDPANKYEGRNISFFNSNFLRADRNVPKKGNVSIPGITNYYNTRILADKYLNKSRFGLTISFTMRPKGAILLAGTVVQLQYPRYDWINKKFRIISVTHQDDCDVDIVAEEYDDSFYVLSNISKQAGSGPVTNANVSAMEAPSGLQATGSDTNDEKSAIVLVSWVNAAASNPRNVYTELYSSFSTYLYITATAISGNVITSSVVHGLRVGEQISSSNTINGLEAGKTYYVQSVPSPTTFTLSETKNGPIYGLIDGTDIGAIMMTATLIATVPYPTSAFVDAYGGEEGRVIKYYWVRHKVIQIT